MKQSLVKKSKFLSLVLRHNPEAANITLDENGWASVDELIAGAAKSGKELHKDQLFEIVETNEKKRFALSSDKKWIRANQGHSINVDVELEEKVPPIVLYHGTATKNRDSILENGLIKRNRLHVHLSVDEVTAHKVGMRHGKPLIFVVDAKKMHDDGYTFFLSQNGVWLTDSVPTSYLKEISK